jgi:spermidine/putrescine transport system permease protein
MGKVALRGHAALVLAFLWAPVAVLALYSFSAGRYATQWSGFSLQWYARLFDNPALAKALFNTAAVGLSSAALATALGTLLALALERRRSAVLEALVHLPLLVPEIVVAVGLLVFWARLVRPALGAAGLELGSLPAVVAGHVAFQIPFVAVVVRARLRDFDPALLEAALDLGATPARAFARVVVPFLAPALASAACLALSLSLDDFYITYFSTAGGSGFSTLPLHVYVMQGRSGMTPEVNALATLMLLSSTLLVALSLLLRPSKGGFR